MKITFTFGATVKIILNQDKDGYYVYTPDNNLILPIKFFSVKDAITFFSSFLPTKVYDKDENSLSFLFTVEYESKTINFYMKDVDRTKIDRTDYNSDIQGFNDFWSKNRKVDDSIDDVVWYFIKWVETIPKKKASVLTLAYHYFTSKVYWASSRDWWYVDHIFDKADKDILKGDAITGKYIQELQAKFEDYIDKYLKERNQ